MQSWPTFAYLLVHMVRNTSWRDSYRTPNNAALELLFRQFAEHIVKS